MKRLPWRNKLPNNHDKLQQVTPPGGCVSVYQLESSTPVFISQLKVRPTKKHYHTETIFSNHYSDLRYVYLQKSPTSDDMVQVNKTFKAYIHKIGVKISYYHVDNGRLQENAFMESVSDERHIISFCRVNAHFQSRNHRKRLETYKIKPGRNFSRTGQYGKPLFRYFYVNITCNSSIASATDYLARNIVKSQLSSSLEIQ